MESPLNELYEFSGFRLDAKTVTLWRGNDVVSLSPKAAELLKLLVSSGGRVVSKQEIFDSIWPDTFVEDGVLTQNIYTLRHALGPDSGGRQFIETVPRRGYRFASEVTVIAAGEKAAVAEGGNVQSAFSDYEELSAELIEERPNRIVEREETEKPTAFASPTSTATPARSSRLLIVAGLILVALAAAGWGIYRFMPRAAETKESKIAPIEQVKFQSLTDTGDITHPTISPNGETLAYVRLDDEQASVWVKQIATGASIQILPPRRDGYRSLTFSPDGKFLYFRDESNPGAIYQTSALGGTPRKIAENVWSDFSMSPDNARCAFVRRDVSRNAHILVLANIDGGEIELGERRPPENYRGGAPAWSPDGMRLAVTVGSAEQTRPVLALIDVNSGGETILETPQFREISRILWTNDARQLILAGRLMNEGTSQLWMFEIGTSDMRRLTNDLESYFWLSLSADGRSLVTRQQRITCHLWILPDGDLKKARQITSGGRNIDGYVGLTWTPDGRIVFSSRIGHDTDLYSIDESGRDRVQLTANTGHDSTWPTPSGDGRYIFFTSLGDGARSVWRMDADGRNQKRITSRENRRESSYSAAPSPDGTQVFFIKGNYADPSAIWKTSVEGGEAIQVSNLAGATVEGFLSVSPDGKWLAYQHVSSAQGNRNDDSTVQIGVLPADGSGEPRLFDVSVRRPIFRWTSDRTLDYPAGSFNTSSLWRLSLDGESKKLVDFPDRLFNFAWSANGKDLVVSRGTLRGDAVLVSNLP